MPCEVNRDMLQKGKLTSPHRNLVGRPAGPARASTDLRLLSYPRRKITFTVMDVPRDAARGGINKPMMESPGTLMPSFITTTSAPNRSTTSTNAHSY